MNSRIIKLQLSELIHTFSWLTQFYVQVHTSTNIFQRVVPPRVADNKKCVPYFLIRFSVICWRVGRRPKSLMLRKNSGARGRGEPRKFLLSTARLFTFQRPNSLKSKFIFIHKYIFYLNVFIWKVHLVVYLGSLHYNDSYL